MDEPTDHLKAFEETARISAITGLVCLTGLDEARAHQRGEDVGTAPPRNKRRPISAERRAAIAVASGTAKDIAAHFGVSQLSVFKIKQAHSQQND